jgi:putative ABC transport system permease protein
VIILIAYINYVNFFFARVPQRIKSINTRKILGSSRANLVMILVGESLTFTLISMVLAYVLVHALAPTFVGEAVDMDTVVYPNHKILVISILLPLLTAIAVSIYPALHITSIPPALALKGNITESHDSLLRYILIGFQITASTVLIIVSLFIHRNIDYINSTEGLAYKIN